MDYLTKKSVWDEKMECISKEMEEYAKNYKCKICKKQPEFAWCEHLLKARANKFRKIIINEDAKLLAN
jgi:tRNA splicing ligase